MDQDCQEARLIKRCRSCSSSKLIEILSLGDQYLSDFLSGSKKPHKFPLDIILCKECNLLQLKYTVSPKLLYTERYGYKSGINFTMKNELKKIVKDSLDMVKSNKKIVAIDVGANDGTLLSFYDKSVFRIAIEPIRKFARNCKGYADIVINDYFNYKSYKLHSGSMKADLVTVISCFYDMDEPNKFISDIKKILHANGILVIQQNYLVGMLKNNAFDNIVHEHLEYYSLLSLEKLLRQHGLEVFDVRKSEINGGSFITFISRNGDRTVSKRVLSWRASEKKLKLDQLKTYKDFAKRVGRNSKGIFNLIKGLVETGKTVYVYGASTRGNTLLQFYNLNNKLIKAEVERNPEKWGKNISSLNIPIISERQARRQKPDYMLVLPWFFKEEFLKREKKYIKNGGHFIFPLPEIKVV